MEGPGRLDCDEDIPQLQLWGRMAWRAQPRSLLNVFRRQAQVVPKGEEPRAQKGEEGSSQAPEEPALHWPSDPRRLSPPIPTGRGGEAGQAGCPAKAKVWQASETGKEGRGGS